MARFIVATCKGRLHHLKQVLPSWRAHFPDWRVCLVDWGSEDGAGDWFREHMLEGDVLVDAAALGEPVDRFWKARALNVATEILSRDHGAEWFLLLDADMVVGGRPESAIDHVCTLGRGHWGLEANPGHPGVILCHAEDWKTAGGVLEACRGWGAEDWGVRAALTVRAGARPVMLPLAIRLIPHGREERSRNTGVRLEASSEKNWRIVRAATLRWEKETGRRLLHTPLEAVVFSWKGSRWHRVLEQAAADCWRTLRPICFDERGNRCADSTSQEGQGSESPAP